MKLNNAKDIRQGTRQVEAVYRGDELLWNSRTLPKGWTRCEYLKSDGGQYIQDDSLTVDTSAKFSVGIKFMVSDYSTQYYVMGEVRSLKRFYVYTNTAGTNKRLNFSVGVIDVNGETVITAFYGGATYKPYTIRADFDKVNLDGSVSQYNYQINPTTYNLTLFGVVGNGTLRTSPSRIYEFSISHDGTTNVELIPCLDKSGRPCMFDVVHRKALYNKGTGEFTYSIA